MAVSRITKSSVLQGFPKSRSLLAGNTAYDPASTWLIQRQTPSSGTASVTFSSIPQTYKSLQIRFTYKDTSTTDQTPTAAYLYVYPNNDSTSANYADHSLYGNGTSAVAYGRTSGVGISAYGSYISSNATYANITGVGIIDVLDYASTTKNKTFRTFCGNDANGSGTTNRVVALNSGVWLSTSAITSLVVSCGASGFATGTTIALYGMVG